MDAHLWRFEALDRWFFRDGQPMNIGETAWVNSQFPPSGRTLQGALRAAVILADDGDFAAFRGGNHALSSIMGGPASLGSLQLTGPFLCKDDVMLFPAPLDLVKSGAGFETLHIDETRPLTCDLGTVHLPRANGRDISALAGQYIARDALQSYLHGNQPALQAPADCQDNAATLWPLLAESENQPALLDREPKIGLERNDGTRTAEQGMLYAIAFVRPRVGVRLALLVDGLPRDKQPPTPWLQTLGGENKLAAIEIIDAANLLPSVPNLTEHSGTIRFKLVFTTPALFDQGGTAPLPNGFQSKVTNGITTWHGTLDNGLDCEIVTACLDKPLKLGGWDLARNKPRDLTCYIPAGSVLYCRVDAAHRDRITTLHGSKLGQDTEYGFGHVLLAHW